MHLIGLVSWVMLILLTGSAMSRCLALSPALPGVSGDVDGPMSVSGLQPMSGLRHAVAPRGVSACHVAPCCATPPYRPRGCSMQCYATVFCHAVLRLLVLHHSSTPCTAALSCATFRRAWLCHTMPSIPCHIFEAHVHGNVSGLVLPSSSCCGASGWGCPDWRHW